MKFDIFIVFVVVLVFTAKASGKTFNRCSLARQLSRLGVPRNELPQWTCIAKYESTFRSHAVGPPNQDGSNDYGLFQINNLYWCQPDNGRFSYNGCRVNCNALLSDDISLSVRCAQQIKSQQGWAAWSVWPRCSGALPSVDNCF